mgnify:CR=1 FL=1
MSNYDSEAIVHRLRAYSCGHDHLSNRSKNEREAADLIEQQSARIAKLERDHASAVAEMNKVKALLKGYRLGFKNARQALGDKQ